MKFGNLDSYFERVCWGGSATPTYETLAGLLHAHMSSIPFENFDVLLGRAVRLDLDAIQTKLIHNRRGGYCFEHGTLFAAVLEQIGFRPVRHQARVVMHMARTEAPCTHMFLTVPLGSATFVVDPGFGALAPRLPVPLIESSNAGIPPEEAHWMVKEKKYWLLRTRTKQLAIDCWATLLEEESSADFEVANHYTSTHPNSAFVNRVLARAWTPAGRVTLSNRKVTIWRDGQPHSSLLSDRSALYTVLAEHFGIDLPEVRQLRVPSIPEWC